MAPIIFVMEVEEVVVQRNRIKGWSKPILVPR
jgi:hypothetical protein